MAPPLTIALSDSVLRVTLNRPDSLNSLNEEVLVGIAEVLQEAATDPRVRAVCLGGAGRAFSSGGTVGRIRALRMALLAERISAAEAPQWGLVTAVYPAQRFDDEVDSHLAALLAGPAAAIGKTKEAVNAATLRELETAMEREKRSQSELLESPDFAEGARPFQERRAPRFSR